mmetsp:Transcript_15901/g.27104  ORF Transcript_15901/g.27104 Transcript_15901/m.27104 type:complete len:190 (-) Transcript_15901:114-683(-)|eukprot:CAMPEP_0183726048 /NCGR_PEP_ID=MMETSP0737-20130205/22219_1 /TAXON_ID=385413 /ORGANISM="Thalassiosira miniscula, Strain CCMP1093" /LENGTH=189 /DNA_ID=CAMNT_0025957259 /DNA_START=147 /DNA_END=716 /DNA_ORIENTATION=+
MPRKFSSVKQALDCILSGSIPHPRSSSLHTLQSGDRTCVHAERSDGTVEDEDAESLFGQRFSVQLVNDDIDHDEFVDISALTEDDLLRLKREDSFLYHSICSFITTASRRSDLLNDDEGVVADRLRENNIAQSRQRQGVSAEEPRRRESMVQRKRRFSTEMHPSLISEEMLLGLEELDASALEILETEL